MTGQRGFRFAVQPVSTQTDLLQDPTTLRAFARRVEEWGYEEFYVPDHYGSVDPFIVLAVVAEATGNLRVGPLVLNNEFHHPAMLARTAATLDRLTGGRLVLGLGTGYMKAEHDATGIELRPPGQRVDRFEDSVQILAALLHNGSASFAGAHHQVSVADLGVRPIQGRLPLLIGGHGRRVVGVAGRHADIYQYTGLVHGEGGRPQPGGFSLADIRLRHRWLQESAGTRYGAIECSALVQTVVITDNAATAIATAATRTGLSENTVAESPFLLFGSVDQVVDKLQRIRDEFGINHVVVREAEPFAPVVAALTGT